MTYRIKHDSKVRYNKQEGYKTSIPRWYAKLLNLKDKDTLEWKTDGSNLIISKETEIKED